MATNLSSLPQLSIDSLSTVLDSRLLTDELQLLLVDDIRSLEVFSLICYLFKKKVNSQIPANNYKQRKKRSTAVHLFPFPLLHFFLQLIRLSKVKHNFGERLII